MDSFKTKEIIFTSNIAVNFMSDDNCKNESPENVLFSGFNANLCLIDINDEGLKQTQEMCKGDVQIFQTDIVDSDKMQKISSEILIFYKNKVDIVIGNAGLGGINSANNFSPKLHKKM